MHVAIDGDILPEGKAVQRGLLHHPLEWNLRQKITLATTAYVGVGANKCGNARTTFARHMRG